MIIDFTPASRERSRTDSKSSGVSLRFREGFGQTSIGRHTIVPLLSMVVPAKHRVSEVHYSASSSGEQVPGNEGIGKLPPMSMNLRLLNVGSAAALATTVTGISLSSHDR
jgi:hypothetical protein